MLLKRSSILMPLTYVQHMGWQWQFWQFWCSLARPYSADYSHLVQHVPCGWILSQHWHKIHVADLLQSVYPFVGHMMESSSLTRSYPCTEIWSQIITTHCLSKCCSCSNYRAKTNCILATVIHIKNVHYRIIIWAHVSLKSLSQIKI